MKKKVDQAITRSVLSIFAFKDKNTISLLTFSYLMSHKIKFLESCFTICNIFLNTFNNIFVILT